MTNEIIIAIISAVAGGIVTLLTTLALDKRKEKREDRLEAKKLQREAFQNRPEMQIVDFKDYIVRTGYGVKQKCDIELFVAHIETVTVEGKKKRAIVRAHYKEEHLNPDEWCCVMYTLKNSGKRISLRRISFGAFSNPRVFSLPTKLGNGQKGIFLTTPTAMTRKYVSEKAFP